MEKCSKSEILRKCAKVQKLGFKKLGIIQYILSDMPKKINICDYFDDEDKYTCLISCCAARFVKNLSKTDHDTLVKIFDTSLPTNEKIPLIERSVSKDEMKLFVKNLIVYSQEIDVPYWKNISSILEKMDEVGYFSAKQ